MNKRRSARLQEKEEEKKKAKLDSNSSPETVEQVIQNSPIFDSEIRHVLPNIINNLGPGSFVRLARTCKDMNSFCFNTNNRIKIKCWGGVNGSAVVYLGDRAAHSILRVNSRSYTADSEFVKNLSKMPFVYKVHLNFWQTVDDQILRDLRNYFTNFPRLVISRLSQLRDVRNWEGFAQFIKDYGIVSFNSSAEAPLEILEFFTQSLSEFYYDFHVPDDVILKATTKSLYLLGARISKETFKELIKKFVAGEFTAWTIGSERYADYDVDLFIEAISEVIKSVQVDVIDESAMEASVVYFTSERPSEFHFLKADGSPDFFTVDWGCVHFGDGMY